MKGIIFNIFQEVVRQEFGEDTWDELLEAARLDGAYTSLGNYDDAELGKLVMAASAKLGKPANEIVRWLGEKALPLMAEKYPIFFKDHTDTRSFVLTLNNIIHPEVRKVYPGADVPVFDFDESSAAALVIGYRSARKMCAFAEGLIRGAATHFGEATDFEHLQCMHRGDEKCVFRVGFYPLQG